MSSQLIATALSDGTAPQCGHCDDDLEIGASCAPNAYGVPCHLECASLTPREARAARRGAAAPAREKSHPNNLVVAAPAAATHENLAPVRTAAPPAQLDAGDLVAAAMGLTMPQPAADTQASSRARPAKTTTSSRTPPLDDGDRVAAAMGLLPANSKEE